MSFICLQSILSGLKKLAVKFTMTEIFERKVPIKTLSGMLKFISSSNVGKFHVSARKHQE